MIIRATRRVHCGGIEGEAVRVGGRRVRARRPIIAVLASVPRLTIVWIEIPAAHEVEQNITNFIVRYVKSKTYTTSIGFAKDQQG